MKKILSVLILVCLASLNLHAFEMGAKTFSSSTIKESPELKGLNKIDSGHYKTLINMSAMPAGLKFSVVNDRAAINSLGKPTVEQFTREDLTMVRSATGELVPCFVVSGKGFLPGERVTFNFLCEDGTASAISLIPYPLHDRNEKGDAFVSAELKGTHPVAYEITAQGFKDGEELEFITTAGKAKETFTVKYQEGKPFGYLPSIKKGGLKGVSHLEIKRENGDVFTFDLPWGYELNRYAKGKVKPNV